MSGNNQDVMTPAPWVVKYTECIKPGGIVLDLACGRGRHTRYLVGRGHKVVAVDINVGGLADLRDNPDVTVLEADLEGAPWPHQNELGNAQFDGIIVINYLHRPLFPHIRRALNPGGVLIYETFMIGNEAFGKPSNPAFLLRDNELRDWFSDLDIIAFEQGVVTEPKRAIKQKLCAMKR